MRRLLPVLALLTLILVPGAAEDAAKPAPSKQSALEMIIGSGWTEWQIILLSVVAFAMAIQCFVTVKREAIIPPGLGEDLHNAFAEGVTDEAVEHALSMTQNDSSYMGQVIASALDKKDFGYDAMVAAADTQATAEGNRWNGKIGWLALFASIGTLMGLFGTVWGMIGAFMDMANNPEGVSPAALSGTIGGALITTASGLIVAIPMLVCVFILRGKLNQYILDATVTTNEILDYFRNK